mmetsp:Transcript_149954/g.481875  ORF Transcript_149954/g.481875 Transcript_149954/m.481875 type:complete len:316 (+) Transcript_149954:405-1352(+)
MSSGARRCTTPSIWMPFSGETRRPEGLCNIVPKTSSDHTRVSNALDSRVSRASGPMRRGGCRTPPPLTGEAASVPDANARGRGGRRGPPKEPVEEVGAQPEPPDTVRGGTPGRRFGEAAAAAGSTASVTTEVSKGGALAATLSAAVERSCLKQSHNLVLSAKSAQQARSPNESFWRSRRTPVRSWMAARKEERLSTAKSTSSSAKTSPERLRTSTTAAAARPEASGAKASPSASGGGARSCNESTVEATIDEILASGSEATATVGEPVEAIPSSLEMPTASMFGDTQRLQGGESTDLDKPPARGSNLAGLGRACT